MQVHTNPQAAITGGSCLQGGNRRRRVEAEPTQEPAEKVDIGAQVEAVVKQASEMAQATGSQVTLEVGGIKVTVSPKQNQQADPHKPIAQIDEPAAEPEVRPEVAKFLGELKDGSITGVRHTTRGIPRMEPFKPEAPKPFGAGRFAVNFDTKDGQERGFIVQTEDQVGHLHNVIPGQTEIGGHVSILSDPQNDRSEAITLTRDEQDAMLSALYGKSGQMMTDETARQTNATISFVAAVRYSGEGGAAVTEAHRRLA